MQNTCLIANYYHPTKFEFCYWDKDFQTLIKAAARHGSYYDTKIQRECCFKVQN